MDVFAYPIALILIVVIFALIFWRPIARLIDRVQHAKMGENTVEFGDHRRAEQQVEQQSEIATSTTTATSNVAVTSITSSPVVEASHAMPPPHEAYAVLEEEVRNALPTDRPAEVERAWLVRALVMVSVLRTHDAIYRLIFGSQLGLLLQANTGAPPNMEQARTVYDNAATNFPDIYSDFSFDAWLDFPRRMGLVRIELVADRPALIRITPMGRDFLHYLVNSGLTESKAG